VSSLEAIDVKLDEMSQDIREIKTMLRAQNGRVRGNEQAIARLQEREQARTAGLVGLQLILAAIAAWLGVSR